LIVFDRLNDPSFGRFQELTLIAALRKRKTAGKADPGAVLGWQVKDPDER
jgi:hypothetical protein